MDASKSLLRIQLSDKSLAQLKNRAALRDHSPGAYAEMIFRYLVCDKSAIRARFDHATPVASPIYFPVEISDFIKNSLAEWSVRHQLNLAAFGGHLLESYLGIFTRDPRDFAMLNHIGSLLEKKANVTAPDLQAAMNQCEETNDRRVEHLSRWIYSRLRPLVTHFERDGHEVELTLVAIVDLLSDSRR